MTNLSRLASLNEAINGLAASADFSSAVSSVLRLAAKLVSADHSLIVLFNKNIKEWALHSSYGIQLDAVGSRGGPALQTAHTGEPTATASSVSLPLRARGQMVGALQVERGGGLTDEDRLALETFAAAAAIAIDSTLSKTDFVSTVTHELRLPMTSIKGYADLLRGGMVGPITDTQKQLLDTVHNNVNWMNALVSDLSDIAKIETGRLKIDLEPVAAAACVRDAVTALHPQFETKTQSVAVNVGALPRVRADRRRLTQVFNYMLTNATHYTPANGKITVAAEAQDSIVRFTVADTGVGMTPEDKAKLFSQFFRSEDSVVRDYKGWGLGLHLVKRLIESFGGQIGAESEYGKGTEFWFTLPVASNQ
ncbi:MAG: GAF domain-containing protein [Chloroflexi bacterium]|nr:GAF domain-containing protein [Chloroflexota bacterium]